MLLFLCVLFFPFSGERPVRQFSVNDGLPSGIVYALTQDQVGHIWVGTKNGLVRYDGYRFTTVKSTNHMEVGGKADNVSDLETARNGDLWVATWGGGVLHRQAKRGTLRQYRRDPSNAASIGDNEVQVVLQDRKGRFFFGTHRHGLYCFDPATEAFSRIPLGDGNERIWSICEGRDGLIWVGTSVGLFGLGGPDPKPPTVVKAFSSQGPESSRLNHDEVREVYADREGTLWIGSRHGLNLLEPERGRIRRFDPNEHPVEMVQHPVNAVFRDSSGNVWVGATSGLFRYDASRDLFEVPRQIRDTGLKTADIRAIYEDRGQVLWVGTNGGGLFKVDLKPQKFAIVEGEQGLRPEIVVAVIEDPQGTLWFSSGRDGLYAVDADTGAMTLRLPILSESGPASGAPVVSIAVDGPGHLLLGTYGGGLLRYDCEKGTVQRFPDRSTHPNGLASDFIPDILVTSEGEVWVSLLNSGVARLLPDDRGFEHLGYDPDDATTLDGDQIEYLYEDTKGRIWASSSYGGLKLLERGSGTFVRFRHDPNNPRSIGSNQITAILEDDRGRLWVGTQVGLARFDGDGFAAIAEATKNFSIMAILADARGHLWLSGKKGLMRYEPETGNGRLFTVDDGLQSLNFHHNAAFKSPSGQMFFAGGNGVNAFFPDRVRDNPHLPTVHITSVDFPSRNAAHIGSDAEILLKASDRILTVEFAALDFTAPHLNRYAYRLEGLADEWTDLGNKHNLNLFTLPHGTHTLEIKGSNNDGHWNPEPAVLKIRKLPPIWRTWWAYGLYIGLVLFGLLVTIRIRTLVIQRRADRLEAMVLARTRELEQRNRQILEQKETIELLLKRKKELFANVSHEFRTPITLILEPIRKMRAMPETWTLHPVLEMVERNGTRLLRMVDQLLDLARLSMWSPAGGGPTALAPIATMMLGSFEPLSSQKGIVLEAEVVEDLWVPVAREVLEKIGTNLLSNAIKYTPEGGHIAIGVVADGDSVLWTVRDTGIGIPQESHQAVFNRFTRLHGEGSDRVPGAGIGLTLVKELVEANDGRIVLESEPGKGSAFTVIFSRCAPDAEDASRAESDEAIAGVAHPESEVVALECAVLHHYQSPDDAEPPAERSVQTRGKSVLVIEDNPDMRTYLVQHIESHGDYRCHAATDGDQGVAMAFEMCPDVVICDVMMPGQDGFAVVRTLKSDARTSHIPVLLLTARGDRDSRLQGWREWADEYMVKPFDSAELLLRIESLLEVRNILRNRHGRELNLTGSVAEAVETSLNEVDRMFLEKLEQTLATHYANPDYRLKELSHDMGMSPRPLQRKVKAVVNHTPLECLQRYRLTKAAEALKGGHKPSQVAFDVGFSSHSYFSKCFKAHFGVSPSEYAANPGGTAQDTAAPLA